VFWVKYIVCCIVVWLGLASYFYYCDMQSLASGGKGLGTIFFVYLGTPLCVVLALLGGVGSYLLKRRQGSQWSDFWGSGVCLSVRFYHLPFARSGYTFPRILRYSPGVIPVVFLNAAVK
jgi:hypothetical protein